MNFESLFALFFFVEVLLLGRGEKRKKNDSISFSFLFWRLLKKRNTKDG